MTNLLNGAGPGSWRRLLLGSGVLVAGFRPGDHPDGHALRDALDAAARDEGKRLGRTAGEISFRVEPELAEIRRDAPPWPLEGEDPPVRLTARLSGTLTEVTAANLLRLLPWAAGGPSARITVPFGGERNVIRDLCWAGSLSGGRLLLICLRNAVNRSGLSLTVRERGEGRMPFCFTAVAERIPPEPRAPFEIWLTEEETSA